VTAKKGAAHLCASLAAPIPMRKAINRQLVGVLQGKHRR
jgi:hypothetical protein